MKRSRNWVLFALIVVIWSSGWSVMKVTLTYVGVLNFTFQRFVLGAVALSPFLICARTKIPREKRAPLRLLILGALNASSLLLMYWGTAYETSGISAVLTYTQPIFVFCLCILFLRAEAQHERLLGTIVGFSGVILLSVGRTGSANVLASTGDVLLIAGAFMWAVTLVYYKRNMGNVDPVVTTVIQQGLGALYVAPLALALEGFYFPLTQPYLALILYLGIFVSGGVMYVWLYLVREEDVTVISSSSFLIPIVAIFLGWFFLAEEVQPWALLGIALVLVGIYLTNRLGSSKKIS